MSISSLLRRMFQGHDGRNGRTARERPALRRELRLETLEERNLLSDVSYNPTTGMISIIGSDQDDQVKVAQKYGLTTSPYDDEVYVSWDFAVGDEVGSQLFPAWRLVPHGGYSVWTKNLIYFNGKGGRDRFECVASDPCTLYVPIQAYGGSGNDTLIGGVGADFLSGQIGDDQVYGGDGNDTIYGGYDDDVLHGENGNDIIHGDDGNDELDGGLGNDTLYGDDDNDTLHGGAGWDALFGGTGSNVLFQDGF